MEGLIIWIPACAGMTANAKCLSFRHKPESRRRTLIYRDVTSVSGV